MDFLESSRKHNVIIINVDLLAMTSGGNIVKLFRPLQIIDQLKSQKNFYTIAFSCSFLNIED